MKKNQIEDKDTRYFLDLDLRTGKILGWDHGQRHSLQQEINHPDQQRVFLTKGQYKKLESKAAQLKA